MEKAELVAIRDVLPGDFNFIYATLLRGLYYGSDYYRQVPKDIFMKNYHAALEKFFDFPNIRVRVACLKDDPEVILGYVIDNAITPITHWVFVKSAWRGIGIAKALVDPKTEAVTHMTKVAQSILKKHPGVVFNPFVI